MLGSILPSFQSQKNIKSYKQNWWRFFYKNSKFKESRVLFRLDDKPVFERRRNPNLYGVYCDLSIARSKHESLGMSNVWRTVNGHL